MNDNPQSTMRALQPDEIDEVSGGMLQHLAIWAMATSISMSPHQREPIRQHGMPATARRSRARFTISSLRPTARSAPNTASAR